MKKKIVALVFVLALGWAGAVGAEGPPVNGVVKKFDGMGRLEAVLQYKKGKLARKRIYHVNGHVLFDTVYQDGKPVRIKSYYETGPLKSFWTQDSGEAKFYFIDGRLKDTVKMPSSSANQ